MGVEMGKVCTKTGNRHEAQEGLVYNKSAELNIPQPVLITENDVMVVDFTRDTFGEETIAGVKEHIGNYIPVDIRCSREKPIEVGDQGDLNSRPHSFVSVVGRKSNESTFTQLSMEVDFFATAIQVLIGPEDTMQKFANRKSPIPEHFFFAEDQAVTVTQTCDKGFHQILDWVLEHRYKKLAPLHVGDSESENMGKQLYDYILTFYK